MSRITFKDIHIGDKVCMNDNTKGIILKIDSIEYQNHLRIISKLDDIDKINYKFKFDSSRNNTYFYKCIIIYNEDTKELISYDIQDIKYIIYNNIFKKLISFIIK